MTLYLHIGAQKTGSTTIQEALYHHRDMLRKTGLDYPDPETDDTHRTSHYNAMRGFFSDKPKDVAGTKSFVSRVNGLSGDVLISTEVISNWPVMLQRETPEAYWTRKRGILQQIRDSFVQKQVRIIYCVRHRASYLKSLFNQHLKMLDQPSISIQDELETFLDKELIRSDSDAQIKVFRDVFGDVQVIDFDAHAKAGTLLSAFTALLDRDIDLRHAEVKNVSPDWTSLELQRLQHTLGITPIAQPDPPKRTAYNAMIEELVSGSIAQRLSQLSTAA